MRIPPGMSGVRGPSVIDVAAIAEAAAVAEPMFRDDCVGVVHEAGGFAPAALIEITGCTVVVARVRNVAAMRRAADVARRVAIGDEVGDQRPEPVRERLATIMGPATVDTATTPPPPLGRAAWATPRW